MKLAIRIQATNKRQRWVDTLLYLLNDRRAKAIFDNRLQLWNGAKTTLLSYNKTHTHMLVLQDDVLPCKDFIKTVEKIIEILPDQPITLFSNKEAILEAKNRGINWVKLRKWLMAQTYIMPISIIEDFLIWEARHIKPEIYYDDNRWAMYFFYHKKRVWATAPSLVEHLGWNNTSLRNYTPSFIFEPRNRMAKWFIGFENSGLSIDWSKLEAYEDLDGQNSDFCHYYIP